MGSTRLPGKVLADIAGKKLIQIIIERVSIAKSVDKVVVATTGEAEDDILVNYLKRELNCFVFRGSATDVLSRFFECAKEHQVDIIVRVTADDPLKDPQIIDEAVNQLKTDPHLDYCSNTIEPTYPEGLDIEVFRFESLKQAHFQAKLMSEREHVTPYICKHPDRFNVSNFKYSKDLSKWRWTVDKPKDLEFVRCVFKKFENTLVKYQDVIAWLELHPEVQLINAGTIRNEGYLKSLQLEEKDK